MNIARILYPVKVLGPGNRIGIWFCGCPRRCSGCSNPELWDFKDEYEISIDAAVKLVSVISSENKVDGFTITGGDPLYQANEFRAFLKKIKEISPDILVYTGYNLEDIEQINLENIAVLIDGEYIEDRNNNCLLRGSDNQKIYILDEKLKEKYTKYLQEETNKIQNFTTCDGIVSVGIHKKGFKL